MTKILIVDQDQDFAAELRTELAREGCNVRIAVDGPSGLTAAAAEHPDLIVLSAEIPKINGFSVCNKLKKSPALGAVPVLLLSSRSTPEAFEHHARLPTRADDYIHKPIPLAALVPRIRALTPLRSSEEIPIDEGPIEREPEPSTLDVGPGQSLVRTSDAPVGEDPDEEEDTVVANAQMIEKTAAMLSKPASVPPPRGPRSGRPPPPPVSTRAPRDAALATVNQHLAEVRRQLAEAERRAKLAEQKAQRAEALADQLSAERALADKRAADFKVGAKKMADQLNQRSREMLELQAAHEARIAELQGELEALRAERAAHDAQAQRRLDALREEQERQIRDLQHENAEALQQVGYDLQEKLMQKEESFKALKEQLDSDLHETGEEARSLRERIAELEQQLATLAEERDDALARAEALGADAEEQQQERVRERAEVEAIAEATARDRQLLMQLREQLVAIVSQLPSSEP